jgi:AcrR family transcriptional regulator
MTKHTSLKTEILDIGWKVLQEKGREALHLRDLAEKGGCSVGTIYNLFENVDEIILRLNLKCLDLMYRSLHREMEKGIEKGEDLKGTLRRTGKAYLKFGMEYPFLWKSLFENLTVDPLPEWYQKKVEGGIEEIERAIVESYGLKSDRATEIVSFFWSAIHGITSIMLNKKRGQFDEAYLNSYIDHCLKGFVG